ncbi:prepilin peptidase [Candidatus Marinamargulisbacteria bacterium]|nr:prepilin peptidase [Candidatus Marinamargulisbacteria bacterium]
MAHIILTVSGLLLGSFLNMLIYRLPRDMNWITDRSRCPACTQPLSALDLIPILSYCITKGRCRQCQSRIPTRYIWVELLTPGALWLAYFQYPAFTVPFIKLSLFYILCIAIFFADLETYIIPNPLSHSLIGLGLVEGVIGHQLPDRMIAATLGFGIYYGIGKLAKVYYKKEALGGGDLKLAAGIGALWGTQSVLLSLYLSFFVAAAVAIPLLLLRIKSRHDPMPFGPAIVIASLIAIHYGDPIIDWWL